MWFGVTNILKQQNSKDVTRGNSVGFAISGVSVLEVYLSLMTTCQTPMTAFHTSLLEDSMSVLTDHIIGAPLHVSFLPHFLLQSVSIWGRLELKNSCAFFKIVRE
jgi:hypothetical protein